MAANNLTLAMKLLLDSQQFVNGMTGSRRAVTGFTGAARRELGQLSDAYHSVTGRLAAIGVGVGATATIVQSAKLDKSLTQIRLTAGASAGEVEQLRNELFGLSKQTGTPLADLQQGFNDLIQSGLNWNESLQVIRATNKATAVTNAQVTVLTKGLSVAGAAFQFDLSKPQMAVTLLDKMVVAGRLGNAELESLSDIFARVGVNASSAGMGFDKTLAFIEGLSMIERQPERLATLADSTLRVFTNARYMKTAQAATGVKFFDAKGARRDGLEVLDDLKKKYDKLTTDAQRTRFVSSAFQNADLDTIKGVRTLLGGDMLSKIGKFNTQIGDAGGTLERDLDTAINNAVDQSGRLRGTLREAADGFAKPINDSLTKLIQYTLNSKANGGLGLSGNQLLGATAGALTAGYLGRKFLPGVLGKLAGKSTNLVEGVGMGKALEAAGAATPVYVVNMPASGLGGIPVPDVVGKAPGVFKGLKAELAVLAATVAPYASRARALAFNPVTALVGATAGTSYLAYKYAPKLQAKMDEVAGGRDFGAYLADDTKSRNGVFDKQQFEGTLKIEVMSSPETRTMVRALRSNSPSLDIDVDTRGKMMVLQ